MMGSSIFVLAAAAAAQVTGGHAVTAEQARAQGYAQAQQAIAGVAPVQRTQPVLANRHPSQATGVQAPLNLTCGGGGTASQLRVTSVESDSYVDGFVGTTSVSGDVSGSADVIGWHDRGFSDQVDIRLFSGDDRIRMPRAVLPPIHGGKNGWFKLKHVVADARSIRGSAAVSLLNDPKVYIDRVTGTISISGPTGDYTGQCRVIDVSAAPKF